MTRRCMPDTCERRHCAVCGYHLDAAEIGTCVLCLGQVRRDLIAVMDLVALLPDHALRAGRNAHLVAADPIPGGDALVMLGRGSEGLADDRDTNPVDRMPPAYVLGWWEERWRADLGHPYPSARQYGRADRDLVHAYAYLYAQLDHLAATSPGFGVFAGDLAQLRRYLEQLLRAGDQPDHGVSCFHCQTILVRDYRNPRPCKCPPRPPDHAPRCEDRADLCCLVCRWEVRHARCDQGGLVDPEHDSGWRCPRCRRTYTPGEYRLALNASYDDHAGWRSQPDATRLTGVPRGTIQMWATRGIIRRRRSTGRRVTYSISDIRVRLAGRTETEDDAS